MCGKAKDVIMVEVKIIMEDKIVSTWEVNTTVLAIPSMGVVRSSRTATGLGIERRQNQEILSSVVEGTQGEIADGHPNEQYWWTEQSRVRNDMGVPPSVTQHTMVSFTNLGTPAGGIHVRKMLGPLWGPGSGRCPRDNPNRSTEKMADYTDPRFKIMIRPQIKLKSHQYWSGY